MEMEHFSLLAVLLAALSAFVVGSVWYSPLLFGNAWMREAGISEDQIIASNKWKTFGMAFVFMFIASVNLGFFMANADITWLKGAFYGFLTGFGWVFMGIAVVSMYEMRGWKYILINGCYWVVALTVMGTIIGALQ
jgi:hypothetical protein